MTTLERLAWNRLKIADALWVGTQLAGYNKRFPAAVNAMNANAPDHVDTLERMQRVFEHLRSAEAEMTAAVSELTRFAEDQNTATTPPQ